MSKASEWVLHRNGERPAWPNARHWMVRVSERGWLEVNSRMHIHPGYCTDVARWILDTFGEPESAPSAVGSGPSSGEAPSPQGASGPAA